MSSILPRHSRTININPFRTAVPFWGQITQFSNSLSPKRDWGPKRVNIIILCPQTLHCCCCCCCCTATTACLLYDYSRRCAAADSCNDLCKSLRENAKVVHHSSGVSLGFRSAEYLNCRQLVVIFCALVEGECVARFRLQATPKGIHLLRGNHG